MKIAVIFTGGTIGSSVKEGFLSPNDQSGFTLLQNYRSKYTDDVEFVTSEPYTSLSETLNAEKLNLLIDEVNEKAGQDFDGIIVTHGTDTVQYSAAALSFTVNPLVPICVVTSNYSLDDKRANGNDNFYAAVQLIKTGKKGIFVPYRNPCGRLLYHRADAIFVHPEMSDELNSVGGPVAELQDGKVKFSASLEERLDVWPAHFVKNPGILSITATPEDGFNYNLDNVKAVLIKPYHSGTLDVESPCFRRFCFESAEKEIPVFVADVLEGNQYATSKQFDELGLIPLVNTPSCLAYMKLWLAVSIKADTRQFMYE